MVAELDTKLSSSIATKDIICVEPETNPVPSVSKFKVTAVLPAWLVVNVPPPLKFVPAVTVSVELLIPANADTCAEEDTIPVPSKSN